ncbi:hypothetical protein BG61_40800 [Caballeronia glathei]|uniref:Uncharacterized protein n=1 Tax=Caballeronia glathei TaxID=60547 RepID=A0A069PCL3_9BURK|nr:hypothetical protein BG61_40800 [Caballeronia glathei]
MAASGMFHCPFRVDFCPTRVTSYSCNCSPEGLGWLVRLAFGRFPSDIGGFNALRFEIRDYLRHSRVRTAQKFRALHVLSKFVGRHVSSSTFDV